jgi:hypothetical protein
MSNKNEHRYKKDIIAEEDGKFFQGKFMNFVAERGLLTAIKVE